MEINSIIDTKLNFYNTIDTLPQLSSATLLHLQPEYHPVSAIAS